MRIDFSHKYAEVYRVNDKGTCFVKISFPGAGVYVGGVKVVPSKENKGEFVVYKPKLYVGNNNWKTNYEFSNSSELWLLIKEEALKAVDEYSVTATFTDNELDNVDKALGKVIDSFNKQEEQPP